MTKSNEITDLNSKDLEGLKEIYKEIKSSNHHAFLIESDSREKVFPFLKQEILNKEKNPNENLFLSLQVFDIKKAKEISDFGKLFFNELHFILVSFYSINREAQNALLKFLEEAPKNLKIILISHSGAKILNTVYSRLYKIDYFESGNSENKNQNIYTKLAKSFLKTKKLSRMKLTEVAELLEKKDEYALNFEDKERSDREAIEIFLLALHEEIFLLFKKELAKKTEKEKIKILENNLKEITEFLRYVKNNSSSGKTILEYLSLKLLEL
ncbi:MAG: polymerase subunit delta [Patescibacteria group bacterium]|nr:polymerase subunit delta [Patescibacteria group bacterium]